MIRVEQRASTVLYKWLSSNCQGYTFLIPANVCSVVPLTFLKAGVDFDFVDIDPVTHAGSFAEYFRKLRHMSGKKGVLFVNAYGHYNDTAGFFEEIKRISTDIPVIEDNCLCIPETERTAPKTNVNIELYSTGYSKYVQLAVGGGYGIIEDEAAYDDHQETYDADADKKQRGLLRECRINRVPFVYTDSHWLKFQRTTLEGVSNSDYMAMVHAGVLQSQTHKQYINHIYDSFLPDVIKMGANFNNWRYQLLLPNVEMKKEVLSALERDNLFASGHYASAAFLFKLQYLTNTEEEAKVIVNLFNEEKYSKEMAIETANIIKEIYNQYDKQRKI